MSKLRKSNMIVRRVAWGTLLLPNGLFYYLFVSGPSHSKIFTETFAIMPIYVPYIVLSSAVLLSYLIYKSLNNPDQLKKKFRAINIELEKKAQLRTPTMIELFEKMDEPEKRKYLLENSLIIKMTIPIFLSVVVNVIGFIGTSRGMPRDHYYLFFAVAIALMLISYPKVNRIIEGQS